MTTRPADQESPVTEATRHLCAGVYLDRAFRQKIIRKVNNDPRHRVAPSYGFDLIPVVEHAQQAWALEVSQQACILSVLSIGLLSNAPAGIMAVTAIGLWRLAGLVLRTAPEVIRLKAKAIKARGLRQRAGSDETGRLQEQARLLGVSAGGCMLLIAISVIIAVLMRTPLKEVVVAAAVLLLMIAVVSAAAGAVRQFAMNGTRWAESLRPRVLSKRQKVIDGHQSHTYVVYCRPPPTDDAASMKALNPYYNPTPTPFVGSGKLVHRWLPPLVVQLLRPGTESMEKREYIVPPFKAHELVNHLKVAMAPVGDARDPIRLRGFELRDRLYIAETDVPSQREFLRADLDPRQIAQFIDDPHGIAHHYLEFRVTDTGELVTTAFVRVTVKGRCLSLDFAACALTRTPSDYHVLDAHGESGKGAVLRSVLRGLRDLPDDISSLWRLSEVPVVFARAAWARKDRSLVPRRGVTIGTRLSVREEKAVAWSKAQLDQSQSTIT